MSDLSEPTATDASSPEVFEEGLAQILAPLTDDVDDNTVTVLIHFALQAIGTDSLKLQSLVHASYNKATPRNDCSAKLLVKLLKSVASQYYWVNGELIPQEGLGLARSCLLNKCQADFESAIGAPIWSNKSMVVIARLYSSDFPFITESIVENILTVMCESDRIFSDCHNMQTFANMCMACGPKMDQNTKCSGIAPILDKTLARASNYSMLHQLVVVGLISVRENDWKIERTAALQVQTPSGSECEVKYGNKFRTEHGA